jgi:hypothetical protein
MAEPLRQDIISPSGWTVDTLKALMDERDRRYAMEVSNIKDMMTAAMLAVRETTIETKHQTDKWQASANEWRQAMTDKDRNFVTKSSAWGYLVGLAGFILMIMEILGRFGK